MTQAHYYGDKMRKLLLITAVIMVVAMPFFYDLIPKPPFLSVLGVLILVVVSGLINPKGKNIVIVSTITAAAAFIMFQSHALVASHNLGTASNFFLINELLAIICLIATYLGTKSVRGITQAEGL